MNDAVLRVFDNLVNDFKFVHPDITDWHRLSATPENPSGVLTTNLCQRNLANTLVSALSRTGKLAES